jgi:alkyldihydroxyacetonephosphate synthase
MLRLSNPIETETNLILSGKNWIDWADQGLKLIGQSEERCLLIFGVTGSPRMTSLAKKRTRSICRSFGGLFVGTVVGHAWEKSRFLAPYLRNTLWEAGLAVDTLETALPWSQVRQASQAIPDSISNVINQFGEQALVMTHLSHIYHHGASIYITYIFRRTADPDQLLERWKAMKVAASREIQKFGGTITHQHGIGLDHKSYLPDEKGPLGIEAIQSAAKTFDPEGILNPGKLFD